MARRVVARGTVKEGACRMCPSLSASHRVTRRARPDLMEACALPVCALCTRVHVLYRRLCFLAYVIAFDPRASIEPSSCSLCPADTTRFHVRVWDVYSGYSLLPEHVVSF